jgi:Protein of unknown function (DUF1573)
MRCAFIFLLFMCASAGAQLKFEKQELVFHKESADKKVDARFTFSNTGQMPVTIRSLSSSCGCTKPRIEKMTYAPGERGEVITTFEFGWRRGQQKKMVWVQFENPQLPPVMLYLNVFINEPLKISPAFVFWRQGETGKPKLIEITSDAKNPVRILDVTASDRRLQTDLKTVNPGTHYVLSVRPAITNKPLAATLSIKTDYPPASPRIYTVHAHVK